jgi:glycosyltransferase involved in cell wall biosynthesis
MKIALVHDWLTGMRGGERVLEHFLRLYPQADVYTLLHVPGVTSERIDSRVAGVSFLQQMPSISKVYRYFLPLYPAAARSISLKDYDVVISLSHAAAKNVRVPPGALHVCYCFTPMRYLWDQATTYFGRSTLLLWPVLQTLRGWDKRGAQNIDHFVAISKLVAARIRSFYGRSSTVVHPAIEDFWLQGRLPQGRGDALLYAGALVPYKRVDLIIEACAQAKQPLWIVGKGPLEESLKAKAGRNVQFFGMVDDEELRQLYMNCKALVFAAKEDFGLIPLECQAVGRPVIGFYDGGLKETVAGIKLWDHAAVSESRTELIKSGYSGVFVQPGQDDKSSVRSLLEGIQYFLKNENLFTPTNCRTQALLFSQTAFLAHWSDFLRSHNLHHVIPTGALNAEREAAII